MNNDLLNPSSVLALGRESLEAFALAVQPGYESAPHTRLVISELERLEAGEITKLALVLPPRHSKSMHASILFPAFLLGRNPRARVVIASYGSELAEGFGRRIRNIVGSPIYRSIFPGSRISQDLSRADKFDTTQGGGLICVGREGSLTGFGADYLILDDLVKDDAEGRSPQVVKNIIAWIQSVAFTRLHRGGKILGIGTRWSESDVLQWLIREQHFHTLHLPAVSLGGDDPLNRPEGAPLWPGRFPLEVLQRIREGVGPSIFQSLYQGSPTSAVGTVFQRSWFRTFDTPPDKFEKVILSLDTAYKVGAENDYSVATVWATSNSGYYLLHLWRDRVAFPTLKKFVVELADTWAVNEVVIEDHASGTSLIQEITASTRHAVTAVRMDRDKRTRAETVTPLFASGKVLFPRDATWRADLEDELCAFPYGRHDDQVDSVTMALSHLRGSRLVYGVLEFLKSGRDLFIGAKTPETPTQKNIPSASVREVERMQKRLQLKRSFPTREDFEDKPLPPCDELGEDGQRCNGARFHVSGFVRCQQCGKQTGEFDIVYQSRDGLIVRRQKA